MILNPGIITTYVTLFIRNTRIIFGWQIATSQLCLLAKQCFIWLQDLQVLWIDKFNRSIPEETAPIYK